MPVRLMQQSRVNRSQYVARITVTSSLQPGPVECFCDAFVSTLLSIWVSEVKNFTGMPFVAADCSITVAESAL